MAVAWNQAMAVEKLERLIISLSLKRKNSQRGSSGWQ
jgi:hypothetical protein